jgi:hypothetical protein
VTAPKTKPARKAKAITVEPVSAPVTVEAFKGFERDWTCRGYQYALGQTYTTDAEVVRCAAGGFHSCEMPLDVLRYYPLSKSRYALVQAGGKIDRAEGGDTKIASATITIQTELKLPDLIARAVRWILDRAKGNTATDVRGHAAATGNSGHAAATGNSGHAAATGNSGHAAATGDYGHAAATGYSGHAAATGNSGHAFAGYGGTAKAGATGAFAIAWHDGTRGRLVVGTPGENGIKADTWYRADGGKLIEVTP